MVLRSLVVACAYVASAAAFVPRRALVGDALMYAQLVTGGTDVEAPFRYRVIVPWLARALPLAPGPALATVSLAALVASYTLLLLVAQQLGIGFAWAALGLAAAALTPGHLYNYENPYLTDCLALAVLSLCLYALVSRRFALYAVTSTVGIGVRESLIFAAVGFRPHRSLWRPALCVLLALATRSAIRFAVGASAHVDEGPFALFPAHTLGEIARVALATWHALWLVAPLGIALCGPLRVEIAWLALPILASALFTSLLAADTARMFQPLFPFAALGAARALEAAAQGLVAFVRARFRSAGQGA